jgi:hypothetical protein
MFATASVNSLPSQFKRVNDIPAIMADKPANIFAAILNGKPRAPTPKLAISVFSRTPAPRKRAPAKPRQPSLKEKMDAEERAELEKYGVDKIGKDDDERSSESEAGESDEEFVATDSEEEVSDYEVSDDELLELSDDGIEVVSNGEEEGEGGEEGEDSESDWDEEEEDLLLELVQDQLANVDEDMKADLELKETLEGTGVSTRVDDFAARNAMKKYLTPVEMLYPTGVGMGDYTIKNLVVYLLDNAMYGKYTHRKHLPPVTARLHAIDETRKRISLKDGSHESTVLAYKFHLFLAEQLRLAILDMDYSPEVNHYLESIAREDLEDSFYTFRAVDKRTCAFGSEAPATAVLVLRSFTTKKNVAELWYNSANEDALWVYTFTRFWFLPFILKCYVDEGIAPRWKLSEAAVKRMSPGELTTHFNHTCQAMIHRNIQSLIKFFADVFYHYDISSNSNSKIGFN